MKNIYKALLAEQQADGTIPHHPYHKWRGANWVLLQLAELGYPPGGRELIPLRNQVYEWLLSERHLKSVKTIADKPRRCGSQEGNAIFSTLTLGISDQRVEQLISNLVKWQWPDGGWNCDKKPSAHTSSFHETLPPFRALALHARITACKTSRRAAEKAAELFLSRKLFLRKKDDTVMDPGFTRLAYPAYWHYNILAGLKAMAEAGLINDPRCRPALDLLESKRLPDGGWPAEVKFYRFSEETANGTTPVNWGGTSRIKSNPYVTADALFVLRSAGRV
ncbi:MAG: hypothetical protein A2509_00895 [Candidatus Edwardsbacteria bacterium RIFOXYD12_FULL_50_11]|uniref:Squalene cyclase C-terminal domain-containing protein n=1 Tax=Candidatus Edwardsbacteria bacterium GWF2_54_11 TaxID=1817851 RepID=A0A1F5RCB1_9BACT|nr:MAG: hypothetical protein A2502_07580 [Candidatus Edwardsbacteria bacterium RifOxyC12_full_54_24]OGF07541.1 MAG: hypothetical protein A2273_03480 [Candidatus Edwardsbacteria bacterium RifOxyA12_full_54_48]OGF09791.1 MAG: hypothetical protein A3K15_09890 [Candidatus Edwardsbacteria bacterium GWE2_54_12]OGF12054.1 MAG: hypothetical protein A2024_03445 [Candidatus Edwardsbacteria bacterium GWF2_54_11]OGF16152.1 MAG: hypothetical protein A2509_00895 [Candidatus Edwardsbacteria bacterium RIFOXYD1